MPDRAEGRRRRAGLVAGRDADRFSRVPHEAYEEEDDKKRAPRRFTRLLYKLDSVGWTGDRRPHLRRPGRRLRRATQITDGDFEDSRPAWTPDGKSIAFSSARNDDWDVELKGDIYVPAEGGEPERLTPNDANYYAPSYSPDGTQLAVKWDPGGFDFPRHTHRSASWTPPARTSGS